MILLGILINISENKNDILFKSAIDSYYAMLYHSIGDLK